MPTEAKEICPTSSYAVHPPTYRPFYAFVHLTKFAGRVGGGRAPVPRPYGFFLFPLFPGRKPVSVLNVSSLPSFLITKKRKKEGKRKQTLLFHHRRFAERSTTAEKYHRIRPCLPSSGKVAAVGVVLAIDVFHTI